MDWCSTGRRQRQHVSRAGLSISCINVFGLTCAHKRVTTADTCTVALTVPRLCCGFAPNATGGPYLSVADKPARWSINVLRARRFVQNSTCRIRQPWVQMVLLYLRYALFVWLFLGTVPWLCPPAMLCVVFICAHFSGHVVGRFSSITVIRHS